MEKNYTIGEVSKLLNVPRSTIRYWDEQGLIHSNRHEENDYRLFDIDDIFQIYDIDFYRKLDVPIKQMKNLYGQTIEEHYKTIAETEKRIYLEKKELQKKHEEILKRKEQLEMMLAHQTSDYPVETPPFKAIVMVDSEDILDSKPYLETYASFGSVYDFSVSDEMIYGFCTDEKTEQLPMAKMVWQKDPTKKYRRFLLKVEVGNTKNNNIDHVKDELAKQGIKTGNVIGQYLLTNTTEKEVFNEYYQAWIESF